MARKKKSRAHKKDKDLSKEEPSKEVTIEKDDKVGVLSTKKKVRRKKKDPDATKDDVSVDQPTAEGAGLIGKAKGKKKDKDKEKEKDKEKDKESLTGTDPGKTDAKTPENGDNIKTVDNLDAAKTQAGTVVGNVNSMAPKTATPVKTVQSNIEDTLKAIVVKPLESVDDEKEVARILTNNPWYHGLMPRDEIEELLREEGDFLVRKTDVAGKPRYAVSVMHSSRIRHILLNYHSGKWWLKDLRKSTLTSLINEHMESKTPVQTDGTLLVKPVPRPDYCILHEHVDIGKKLGGGAFGDVHMGKLKKGEKDTVDVAVKKMKNAVNKKQRSEFVKEAKLMRRFDHPNIVRMLGVAPQEEPILILLELASGGSLQSRLKDHPDLSKDKLTSYATDGCRGMCYLAGRKVIHRDIAARNCLLGKNDEVKISDFGLSVADKSVLKLDKLKNMPIRWLAPETLRKGEFSTKSDVWSFGVLMWEIFSRCKSDPFPGETNAQAKAKILSKEQPMPAPDNSPELIKNIMALCFTQDPEQRPDFEGVFKLLAPKETPPPAIPNFETYTI